MGAEDLGRANGIGFRRYPAPVAAEAVERILHDRHRVELDAARARLLIRFDVIAERFTQMRFPESNVPAPADSAVTNIGPAQVCDLSAVVGQRVLRREVDLGIRRTQVRPNLAE